MSKVLWCRGHVRRRRRFVTVGIRAGLALAVVCASGASAARGQRAGSHISVGVGAALYDGARNEAGVGLAAAVQVGIGRLGRVEVAAEAGVLGLAAVGQVCTLGVPSSCSPDDPASPMWHFRLGVDPRITAVFPVFVTLGVGVYGPTGPARDSLAIAWGVDGGVGVHLGRWVSLEVRYLHLRARRFVGSGIPVTLRFDL